MTIQDIETRWTNATADKEVWNSLYQSVSV